MLCRLLLHVGSLLVMLACALPPVALGQAAPEPPAEYRELIDNALAESAAGRFQEAGALFRKANAVYPNARALRGIGMVAYELRDYVDAAHHLRLALSDPRRPLERKQRAEVKRLLDSALTFVASYELSALPANTSILVDSKPAQPENDGTLLLGLGEHDVEVRSGPRVANGQLVVRGGEHGPLPIVLPSEPEPVEPAATPELAAPVVAEASPEPAPATQTAAEPGPAAEPKAAETSQKFPWVSTLATVTGGAMLVTGLVLVIKGFADVRTVENAPLHEEWAALRAANERAPVLTGVGFGLLGAGAVLSTVGIVGLSMDASAKDDDANGELDGFAMRVRGCF
jgi:hypothetical protein